jgi:hypothetical protein
VGSTLAHGDHNEEKGWGTVPKCEKLVFLTVQVIGKDKLCALKILTKGLKKAVVGRVRKLC